MDPVAHSGAVEGELRRGLGRGEPLDRRTRSRAELLTGRALPDVRVHRDAHTRHNVDLLGSAALTSGNDVLLGGTERGLTDGSGEWLLAHELAHAIQQFGGSAPQPAGPQGRDALEAEADAFAHAFVGDRDSEPVALSPADPGLAQRVIWKYTQDLPGDLLLIIDVDDGDFVGGCVRQIVPHAGLKLIQKRPHAQLFNLHVGFLTNAAGEYCIFFYESVTGICELKCFPTKEAIQEAWEEVVQWLKDMLRRVFIALAIVALIVAAVILAALIAEALAAALLILLAA